MFVAVVGNHEHMCVVGLPEAVRESWEQFKSGPLAEVNKRNMRELVSVCVCVCV